MPSDLAYRLITALVENKQSNADVCVFSQQTFCHFKYNVFCSYPQQLCRTWGSQVYVLQTT